jgi:pimeloyl-ACP methyl ester carboxylesterase
LLGNLCFISRPSQALILGARSHLFLCARPRADQRFMVRQWHYIYPTGQSLFYSGKGLRDSLDALKRAVALAHLPQPKPMVVIGHSMGGLLAKSLVFDSGDNLWDAVFTVRPERLAVSKDAMNWECHADTIGRYQRWSRDVRQRQPSIRETDAYSAWGGARRCSERFSGDSMDHKSS